VNSEKRQLLVVEDDPSIQNMLRDLFETEGYEVTAMDKGLSALDYLKSAQPSAVLLDIGLPDIDGVQVCRNLRSFSNVPVIMVTGNGDIDNKLKGLHAGADDYITKPFSYAELVARIDAILRRAKGQIVSASPRIIKCQDLKIDLEKHVVTINDVVVDLSNTEYRVLVHLANKMDTIVTPGELIVDIWGDEYSKPLHLLQVNISRLRQKLDDNPRELKYIGTVIGQGYILNSK
jgi:two-component system, OmpR family, response regulator RegX3